MTSYKAVYQSWKDDPEGFWMKAAEAVDWFEKPSRALDDSKAPFHRWYTDGVANTCWNAVDRHVGAGAGDRAAILYESPVTGASETITYADLQDRVAKLGGALEAQGVTKGDRVLIYMPMIPEAVVAMLACARIGAIHSVVFGGFAANELAVRIDDAKPKAVLSASCGVEPSRVVAYKPLLDGAVEMAAHKPKLCVVKQRPQAQAALVEGRDHDWDAFVADASFAECAPVGGAEPLYVLYTSGTTGAPKGVVRASGGHMAALNWTMTNLYGVGAGDVFWAASDVGWVVGHSYIVYAPLLAGATTLLFEGKPVGTPDAAIYWRLIQKHRVKALFTAPTALRAIKREDPEGKLPADYDLSSLQTLFLAGERADPASIEWAQKALQVPVIDHWWQTETGWAIAANPVGIETLPVKLGSPTVPMPGYAVEILDEGGQPVGPNTLGAIAIKLPLPPGCLPTLWNADERFRKSYLTTYPGYYETGDAGMLDEEGYVYVMARTDDVINVAGHRLSTGAMEEVLASHADVAECAVIGAADALKGQTPVGFLCLNAGCARDPQAVAAECVKLVREKIGPVAAFKTAIVVARLPKTRSGKVLRGVMAKMADGQPWKAPATIDDAAALDEIEDALDSAGVRAPAPA
jgi:propionyl-CoA synthetase